MKKMTGKIKNIIIVVMTVLLSVNSAFSQSTFSGQRLKSVCLDYIYKHVGTNTQVVMSRQIQDQKFSESGVKAKIAANPESLRGNCYINIEFTLDNRLIKRLQLPVRIKIFKLVPVATRTLYRSNEIKDGDIVLEKMDVTYYHETDIPTMDEIKGTKAKRNIAKGSIITRTSLEEKAIIKRGENVQVIVNSGAVRIRTIGTAMQDASFGAVIKVKRNNGKTILQGRVARDGTVVISSL
jgi:flagella basal body P-ring formation protein FlgA